MVKFIKLWEILSNKDQIQLETEIVFPYKEPHLFQRILYLIPDKNFLVYSGEKGDGEDVTYFFNLKT